MEDCIFCKIVKGEVPCYKIYESEKAIAFLDNNPRAKGHTLVIPKNHFENIHDIPEQELEDVILAVKEVAKILEERLSPIGIGLLQRNGKGAGQEVMHLHFHLVPSFEGDTVIFLPKNNYQEKDFKELHKLLTIREAVI